MRERFVEKIKQNRAFTLMEMLIAVAVLVILLGISIFAVNDWTKSLKMTELDNYAKSIYLEAQNQLAAMEAEGGLTKFYNNLAIEGGTYYEDYSGRRLTQAPTDYDAALYGESYKNLYYFSTDDDVTSVFIPPFSNSNDENGCYLLELNPESGDVYGVFYWEAGNDKIQTYLLEHGTSDVYTLIQDISVLPSRSKESRKIVGIGYYGGGVTETTTATDYKLNQRVELVNEEELYVKISYDYKGRMLNYLDGLTTLTIKVNVIGQDSGQSFMTEIDIAENDYVNLSKKKLETGFLLDGLRTGQDFKSLTSGLGFKSGENLVVSVETRFVQGSIEITEKSENLIVNSLFDSVNQNDGVHTIAVSNIRHLRNLDERYYTETVTDSVAVVINKDLDFENGSYAFDQEGHYIGNTDRPVSSLSPISNSNLFMNNTAGRTVVVNGNDYKIKNLVIAAPAGTENVGLFAEAKNVNFENLRLEDFTVKASGCTNVGALAGKISGGRIHHSGVYLMPYYKDANGKKVYYNQLSDSEYGTAMGRRYAKMSVTGADNVGGLFGLSYGITISDCYSAVEVNGKNDVGGFIGEAAHTTIANSYASGNVRQLDDASKNIGGFIGKASYVNVNDAYTSGNIYGANVRGNVIGGFLGVSDYSNYKDCFTYGEVLTRTGTDDFRSDLYVAGMLSLTTTENHDNINVDDSCYFLRQMGYNTTASLSDGELLGASYKDLKERGGTHSNAASFPYDGKLLYKAFPFAAVTDRHYGDWPLQYLLNTSLAYYEKYSNGVYGFYSVTTLDKISEDGEVISDDYVWVLDSLQDKECVEDGYALLSMYYLEEFSYTTYQYKEDGGWQNKGGKTVTIHNVANENDDYSVLLNQHGFLEFKAYDKKTYDTDYSKEAVRDVFTMSGMYLYQLPYNLQCTDRYSVDNFYDRLVIYNGLAKGNAEPVIGGANSSSGESFFYSPHFAKTAINPGFNLSVNAVLPNPEEVAVRSARQLNAMGRMPYYWNKEGGADKIAFIQETDINFGTYTNGTKEYCGHPFDLMDTTSTIANQPIGQPDLPGKYKQFRNSYDGQCNEIIDFCIDSDTQFVGLFGEIRDAKLSNIFMTVSEENEGKLKITSSYQPKNNGDENNHRAGVGALVGLVYMEGNTVTNCTAAGYTVEYKVETVRSSDLIQPKGIAVGGLFGLCMGQVKNCAAVNDVLLTLTTSYPTNSGFLGIGGRETAVFLGGFAGSFYYNEIMNVYSGGTIDINMTGNYEIGRLRIGGLTPGFMYTARDNDGLKDSVVYKNFYTYTKIADKILTDKEFNNRLDKGNKFDHIIPSVSRMTWNRNGSGNTRCLDEVSVPGGYGAFYLKEVYEEQLELIEGSAVEEYFESHWCYTHSRRLGKTDDPISYDELSKPAKLKSEWELNNDDMSHSATISYPQDDDLDGKSYPFPAFIVDADGNYIHYGDWPEKEDLQ